MSRGSLGMKADIVSVIIPYSPAHTPAEMLEEAKQSVNRQSISTSILVIEDTHQKGPAWARNRGIEKADTRYIAFLDADDLWNEDKLSRQLKKMDTTGAGLCVEGDERTDREFIVDIFLGDLSSVTSSILIDRKTVKTKFDEELYRKEDHLFLIEAADQGGVCLCPNLTHIRKQQLGLSATTSAEKVIRAREEFAENCFNRIAWLQNYKKEFYTRHYYSAGRNWHLEGQYKPALRAFIDSLRQGFYWKTIPAMILSLFALMKNSF